MSSQLTHDVHGGSVSSNHMLLHPKDHVRIVIIHKDPIIVSMRRLKDLKVEDILALENALN